MYPEKEARQAILRNLKRRLEDHEEYMHFDLFLRVGEISEIAEEAGLSPEETARILRTLAKERYIHAEFSSPTGMYSFNVVRVYDLLDRGRIEIGDLPDPRAEMTALLDNLAEAIRTLNDEEAPPEQKKVAERAVNELKQFLRGLPPGVATELGVRLFAGG